MKQIGWYLFRVLLAFDQFLNALFGGRPDHTISGRAGLAAEQGKPFGLAFERLVNALFFFDPDHCRRSIEWDEVEKPLRGRKTQRPLRLPSEKVPRNPRPRWTLTYWAVQALVMAVGVGWQALFVLPAEPQSLVFWPTMALLAGFCSVSVWKVGAPMHWAEPVLAWAALLWAPGWKLFSWLFG